MAQSFRSGFVLGLMASVLALGACGDDDGGDTDAGTPDTGRIDMGMPPPPPVDMGPPMDMGPPPDTGPVDSGPPPAVINVRVAHLTANGPNIKVCMSVGAPGSGTYTDIPTPVTEALAPDGIPYRGISNYNAALFEAGRDYRLRLYAGPSLMGTCPPVGDGDGSLFTFDLTARDDGTGILNEGSWYTLAATGLLPDDTGSMPNVCGLLLNGPCMPGTDRTMGQAGFDIQLLEDADPSDVDPANVIVSVFPASPNAPPLTICYDPDGAGEMPPSPLGLTAVRFGIPSATVMTEMEFTTGTLAVFPIISSMGDPSMCATTSPSGPSYVPLPVPIPAALEAMAHRLDCTFRLGRRYTVFTAGIADNDMMPEPTDTTILPWRDSGEDMDTPEDDGCPAM